MAIEGGGGGGYTVKRVPRECRGGALRPLG